MSRTDQFLAAKQEFRAKGLSQTDAQVAEAIGVAERDTPGMAAIAEARRDTEAGGHSTPHLRGS
jgi:hypothetical protein